MEVVEPDAVAGAAAAPHAHVVVYDLEELARLRDPPRLYLGPDRHVIQRYLEGACADQLKCKAFLIIVHSRSILRCCIFT